MRCLSAILTERIHEIMSERETSSAVQLRLAFVRIPGVDRSRGREMKSPFEEMNAMEVVRKVIQWMMR